MRFGIRAVGVAALCLLATGCSHGNPFPKSQPTSDATPVEVSSAQVNRLADDLVSGAPARVRQAVEMPAGQRMDPRFVQQLDELTVIFDTSSAVAIGADQVQLAATVTTADGETEQWRVILDQVDGRYLIADTVKGS